MSAVMKQEPGAVAQMQDGTTLLAVISRAAADPQCDIEKMERLMQMHERMQSRQAEAEFAAALSEMQDQLPSIGERGNAAGRYTYALWEDINTAIKPVLKAHGFALSFRTDFTDGILVTGVLSHRSGHSERTSIKLPADASGNKNAVQAVASSVSYGKRYTAGALLNLTSHGEDDDAYRAAVERVSQDQAATLIALIQEVKADLPKFLAYMKAESVEDIEAKHYARAVQMLQSKRKAK
ncbi:MAG TPA: single-stranded DNA-binding protein [Gammaproteobacteria bacterium]|nr:single-stranded DNA-binding protein [Gammaproteobacteria bacterium]